MALLQVEVDRSRDGWRLQVEAGQSERGMAHAFIRDFLCVSRNVMLAFPREIEQPCFSVRRGQELALKCRLSKRALPVARRPSTHFRQ